MAYPVLMRPESLCAECPVVALAGHSLSVTANVRAKAVGRLYLPATYS